MINNNQQAFWALVRAGLWEKEVRLLPYGEVDYAEVMRLAQEQAVVGLVAAGLEHVTDVKVPQVWALQFAGQTIQLEQRNKAMNQFIAGLIAKMREADIYTSVLRRWIRITAMNGGSREMNRILMKYTQTELRSRWRGHPMY